MKIYAECVCGHVRLAHSVDGKQCFAHAGSQAHPDEHCECECFKAKEME